MTEPITFNLSDIDQPPQSQQAAPARSMSQPQQPMTFHVSDIDTTPHGASGSWDEQDPSGEEFKSQTWHQAGQHLLNGELRKAASDVGSLFTSQNPAAVEAGSQLKDAGIGAAKSAGQTLSTIGDVATLGTTHLIGPTNNTIFTPTNENQAYGAASEQMAEYALGEGIFKTLSELPLAERLVQTSKLLKMASGNSATARIIRAGLRSGTVGGTVGGVHGGAEGAVVGAAGGAAFGAIGEAIPESVAALKNKLGFPRVTHVFDPETATLRPAGEINPGGPVNTRQAAGAVVQQTGTDLIDEAGARVGAAKDAARATSISGLPSDTFKQTMQDIGGEANKPSLKSIPSDEMKKVKALTDELAGKPSLTHDEFESYSKQLGDRIDDLENTKTDKSARRLYTKAKQALQNEYYSQLAEADPKVSATLRQVNSEYAELNRRIYEGPAKTLFNNQSPELVIKRIVSGSATESQVDDLLRTVREYDAAHPEEPAGSIEQYLKQSTLYNQMQKFGLRSENGLLVRIDPVKMISDMDKNPVYQELYGKDFSRIKDSLIEEANKQARFERSVRMMKGVGRTAAGAGKFTAYTLAALGGAQALGVPIAQTLWSLFSRSNAPDQPSESQ
jgi:hypothetical protein